MCLHAFLYVRRHVYTLHTTNMHALLYVHFSYSAAYTHKAWNGIIETMDAVQKKFQYVSKQVEDTIVRATDQIIKEKRGAKMVTRPVLSCQQPRALYYITGSVFGHCFVLAQAMPNSPRSVWYIANCA